MIINETAGIGRVFDIPDRIPAIPPTNQAAGKMNRVYLPAQLPSTPA
jgi:hypothetical protein